MTVLVTACGGGISTPAKPAAPAGSGPVSGAQPQPKAGGAAKPAASGEQIKWRAALFGPPREATKQDEFLAAEIEKRTNGRMKIELGHGEVFSKSTEIPEGVKAGAFEIGWICGSYYPAKFPLLSVLDLAFFAPGNLDNQVKLAHALFEQPAILEEFKKWNARPLVSNPLPGYQMMGKKAVRTADDLKGLRIRVSGEMARPLEDFGAVKALVPAPEVFTSLDKGVFDMATFPATYAFAAYKIDEISKHYVDKMDLGSQPCLRAVNLDAWTKLPSDLQKTMTELLPDAVKATNDAYVEADKKNIPAWKARGIEMIEFPKVERDKLLAGTQKHYKEWVEDKQKKNLPGQDIFDFVTKKKAEIEK
ncbi:MAG: TRAP transporter substrate-binding protein DctP [Chloroflexi bacterium]|nr:TRAP transporter substrate-binding protein DctP [Chloroflexota bacterium]